MSKKLLSYDFIQTIAVLYIVVWSISPPLQLDMIYRLIALGCAGIWMFLWVFRQNPFVIEKDQLYAVYFLFFVVLVAYIQDGDIDGIIQQIAIYLMVIFYIMNISYRGKLHYLNIIVPVVLILLIIWNFKTFEALLDDPSIARKIVRNDEATYEFLRKGIGGYSLVYPQVIIFPAILAWLLTAFKNNKAYFLLGALWLVSYVLMILNAGYSIAIFTTLVGALLLFFYNGDSSVKAVIVSIVLFVGAIACIIYVDGFRNWLLEVFDGTAVAKKINDLTASTDSGEASGSWSLRIYAYGSAISKIIKYNVFGGLWRMGNTGHSAVLDNVAKYGLVGGYMFLKILYSVPNYYKKKYSDSRMKRFVTATFVTVLLVSILDSFTYSFMAMLFIVLPLLLENIIEWKEVEE